MRPSKLAGCGGDTAGGGSKQTSSPWGANGNETSAAAAAAQLGVLSGPTELVLCGGSGPEESYYFSQPRSRALLSGLPAARVSVSGLRWV